MTTLHEAAQKVLKHRDAKHVFATQIAIDELREALAQPDDKDLLTIAAMDAYRMGKRDALAQQGEQDRATRIGVYILETAKSLGWQDDGEGAYEYIQRLSYAQGVEDAGAAPAPQAQQVEPVKVPGMAVQALAGEIIEALLADEKDGGYDLTAGMFGANFSALVRRWAAAEWNAPAPQAQQPLTDEQKREMATDYFVDDWAINKAIKMIEEYERANGIGEKQ